MPTRSSVSCKSIVEGEAREVPNPIFLRLVISLACILPLSYLSGVGAFGIGDVGPKGGVCQISHCAVRAVGWSRYDQFQHGITSPLNSSLLHHTQLSP